MKGIFSKDFTLVVIGQIISLFGNAILRFALPLYLLRETGSAALFGMVTACSFLPMILLSFAGGIIADRTNKRNIMVVLDFFTALLILLFTAGLGKLPLVPMLVVMLMLLFGISGAYQPAVQASIPVLVPGDGILAASAVINQISSLAGLLGPIIGGVLFSAFGITPILYISIACFVASAVMELFIRIPFERRVEQAGAFEIIKNDVRDSVHYIRKDNPALSKIILLVAAFNLVLSALMIVGMPVIIVNTLQMSDRLLGFSQGASALGGLCGGVLTAVLGNRLKLEKAHFLLFASGALTAVMAAPLLLRFSNMAGYLVVTVMCFCSLALATMFSVQMLAAIQSRTPPELVGKVISLVITLSMCAQPLGQMLYGLALEEFSGHTGVGLVLMVAGVISVLLAAASRGVFRSFVQGGNALAQEG